MYPSRSSGGMATGRSSISAIGPGPRAQRHWEAAKRRGMRISAKIQCGNTWELSAVPYLPVLENITRHAEALRDLCVKDIMLGWTLGCLASPNIGAITAINSGSTLDTLAAKRHGATNAYATATFWRECSAAFREFPYHIGVVYQGPLQMGPANPLWPSPTGYHACMAGIPYDDLKAWRSVLTPEIFASPLEKVASGFEAPIAKLRTGIASPPPALAEKLLFAQAAAIHFASVANQSRAVMARDAKDNAALQSQDSRIGFEAPNQYYYTPHDLVEKVINCRWIATHLGTSAK